MAGQVRIWNASRIEGKGLHYLIAVPAILAPLGVFSFSEREGAVELLVDFTYSLNNSPSHPRLSRTQAFSSCGIMHDASPPSSSLCTQGSHLEDRPSSTMFKTTTMELYRRPQAAPRALHFIFPATS